MNKNSTLLQLFPLAVHVNDMEMTKAFTDEYCHIMMFSNI